jgi:hypothetical protein
MVYIQALHKGNNRDDDDDDDDNNNNNNNLCHPMENKRDTIRLIP